jgi:hypothetical protein
MSEAAPATAAKTLESVAQSATCCGLGQLLCVLLLSVSLLSVTAMLYVCCGCLSLLGSCYVCCCLSLSHLQVQVRVVTLLLSNLTHTVEQCQPLQHQHQQQGGMRLSAS